MVQDSLKSRAINFRKNGKSYNFISDSLSIPKSTLSYWFGKIKWSSNVKELLIEKSKKTGALRLKCLNEIRQLKLKNLYLNADVEANKEFEIFKNKSLFISGLSIYWGEGDRIFKNGQVRVSNIDFRMLLIFKNFLEKFCKIPFDNIKGHILFYSDLSPNKCLRFWSENVKIPKENFLKPVLIRGRSKRRLDYGICSIYVCNKFLKKKILRWIDLWAEELNLRD